MKNDGGLKLTIIEEDEKDVSGDALSFALKCLSGRMNNAAIAGLTIPDGMYQQFFRLINLIEKREKMIMQPRYKIQDRESLDKLIYEGVNYVRSSNK